MRDERLRVCCPRDISGSGPRVRIYAPGVVDNQEHAKGVHGWVERVREHEHAAHAADEVEESVEADLPPTELSIEEDAARESRGWTAG